VKRKTKTCPACPEGPRVLPLRSFGIVRSRPDGRNLYCRACVRRRMQEARAAAKLRKRTPPAPRPVTVQPPSGFVFPGHRVDVEPLVLTAIDRFGGACSQDQIVSFAAEHLPAKLHPRELRDTVGNALGELFQARSIATRGEAEGRIYFRRFSVRDI